MSYVTCPSCGSQTKEFDFFGNKNEKCSWCFELLNSQFNIQSILKKDSSKSVSNNPSAYSRMSDDDFINKTEEIVDESPLQKTIDKLVEEDWAFHNVPFNFEHYTDVAKKYIIHRSLKSFFNSDKVFLSKLKTISAFESWDVIRCEAVLYLYLYWIALADTDETIFLGAIEDENSSDLKELLINFNNFPILDICSFIKDPTTLALKFWGKQWFVLKIINNALLVDETLRLEFIDFVMLEYKLSEQKAWDLLEDSKISLANEALQKISKFHKVLRIN